jgi:hypothetical protein
MKSGAMAKEDLADLKKFLLPFPPDLRDLALYLREFVWDLYPRCNELIYDNYNALAFGWSTTEKVGDTFCSVAVFSAYAHFGFYRGCDIGDPEQRLSGKGNQYRYLVIRDKKDLPKTYLKKLLKEAYANSLARLAVRDKIPSFNGLTITKSISPKKRRL